MNKLLVKVINESSESLGHLHLDGVSGRTYLFDWNKAMLAYCYVPKSQDEIDDLFATSSVPNFPWRFVPVLVSDKNATAAQIAFQPPPFVPRERYANHLTADLRALCEDCGMTPCSDGKTELLVQIDAYMLGRGIAEHIKRNAPAQPPPHKLVEVPAPAPVPPEPEISLVE